MTDLDFWLLNSAKRGRIPARAISRTLCVQAAKSIPMVNTADAAPAQISRTFRPTARLLQLLGDELIASPRLAVFELVKNAYDADATSAVIRLDLRSSAKGASIAVTDDGEGMTFDVLESVWLVPGNNHRKRQREKSQRTTRHSRLPIGEKVWGASRHISLGIASAWLPVRRIATNAW